MRYDLRRRLEAAETRRYPSPRVAAFVRAIKTLSDEEFARQWENRTGLFDLTMLSDAELEWLMDEFEPLLGDGPSQVAEVSLE
jgi:hypothetical protein